MDSPRQSMRDWTHFASTRRGFLQIDKESLVGLARRDLYSYKRPEETGGMSADHRPRTARNGNVLMPDTLAAI